MRSPCLTRAARAPADPGWTLLCLALLLLLTAFVPGTSHGHASGEDYVFLSILDDRVEGRFEIRFDDLREKIGAESDATNSPQFVADTRELVEQYIRDHFHMYVSGEPLDLSFTGVDVIKVPEGTFGQYFFEAPLNGMPEYIDVEHNMLYENDRLHRGLLLVEFNAVTGKRYREHTALVFSRSNTRQRLDLQNLPGLLSPLQFVVQGLVHIGIGLDHILFLIVLLLPAVLHRAQNRWEPVQRFPQSFWSLIKIVTAFTIAHSITLALAALDIFTLSSAVVEPIIALSILLMAINNLYPRFTRKSFLLIFAFGLFHGLGFASVLGSLAFRMSDVVGVMTKVILTFNIGIELGQIAVIIAIFPLLYHWRKSSWYETVVLKGGSSVIGLIALYWFVARITG